MRFILQPWQLVLVILTGWMNQLQQQIIEVQQKEIEVLKKRLGKKRIILNDDERRVLAVKAKVLGRKVLQEIGCLFTPDIPLRWHRERGAPQVERSGWRHKSHQQRLDQFQGVPKRFGRDRYVHTHSSRRRGEKAAGRSE